MVIFYPAASCPNNNCGICWEPLTKDVVAHDDSPTLGHAVHEECINDWLKRNPICPTCRSPIKRPEKIRYSPHIPCTIALTSLAIYFFAIIKIFSLLSPDPESPNVAKAAIFTIVLTMTFGATDFIATLLNDL